MEILEVSSKLALHKMWREGKEGGKRADFRNTDLSWLNLRGCDFREVDLRGAGLTFCDLRCANFYKADLEGAIFSGADINGANFTGTVLEGKMDTGVKEELIEAVKEKEPSELESLQALNDILEAKIMEQGQEIEALKASNSLLRKGKKELKDENDKKEKSFHKYINELKDEHLKLKNENLKLKIGEPKRIP